MDPDFSEAWTQYLDPEVTRGRLIAASVYIASYEFFEDLVVERVRAFFAGSAVGNGSEIDPEYKEHVQRIALPKDRKGEVYQCLEWLKGLGAIEEPDIEAFTRAKVLRNTLAHEQFSLLVKRGIPDEFDERFTEMIALLAKIEVWWIREVDSPVDLQGVADAEIVPGPVLGVNLLHRIALGDDEESRAYLKAFLERPK